MANEYQIIEDYLLKNMKKIPKKGDSKWKILDMIENRTDEFLECNTISLSKKLGVSQAAVSRFASALEFATFNDLQIYISSRSQKRKDIELNLVQKKGMSLTDMISNIRSHYIYAIEKTIELIATNKEVKEYIDRMLKHPKVTIIFGIGESALVAKYFANNLRKVGFNAIFLDDVHDFFSFSQIMKDKIHVTLISKSGSTLEIKKVLNYLDENNLDYAMWTKNKELINDKRNIILFDSIKQSYRIGPLGSKISAFLVADIIFSYLAYKIDKDKTIFKNVDHLLEDWNSLIPNQDKW
ncbi:MurR/RpiR family transcriptional regulator [Mycoplasmopsis edwardii]|uniref:MurR/RpiR family transcriptional regulator n=1 Tax=Mycoplasmopsis edwardii TaxID=53558 RepID=A0ACD4PHM3_9BACT|nr:MurR/RpiR family transcriptional regulator [Mycoplasmopsis edwardii]WBP84157.1 MurR/RpiR family transcriptional regulator [Mycoplasmopsis edwardii]